MLYGNHRDSWVHGAVDPSSGTAVLLEVSRVLGTLLKKGEASPNPAAVQGLSGLSEVSSKPAPSSCASCPTCAKPQGSAGRHAWTPALDR